MYSLSKEVVLLVGPVECAHATLLEDRGGIFRRIEILRGKFDGVDGRDDGGGVSKSSKDAKHNKKNRLLDKHVGDVGIELRCVRKLKVQMSE